MMTEDKWLTTDRVPDLLRHVRRRGTNADRNRRLRVFGCAVMRADWDTIADDRLRRAVADAEEYADDEFGKETADRLGLVSSGGSDFHGTHRGAGLGDMPVPERTLERLRVAAGQ